jgi:hypothetical protein
MFNHYWAGYRKRDRANQCCLKANGLYESIIIQENSKL